MWRTFLRTLCGAKMDAAAAHGRDVQGRHVAEAAQAGHVVLRQVQQPHCRIVDQPQGFLDVEVKANGARIVDDV